MRLTRRSVPSAAAAMAVTVGAGAAQAAATNGPGAAAPARRLTRAGHVVKKMALDSVSCTGTSFCMAVGSYADAGGVPVCPGCRSQAVGAGPARWGLMRLSGC
jgi:hypothetical protein